MKKSWFLLVMAALFVTAVSCNNGISEASTQTPSADGNTYLTVRGVDVVYRTLKPNVDTNKLTNLVLKGTRTDDGAGAEEKTLAEVDSLTELTALEIPVQTGSWSFTLTAELDGIAFSGTKSVTVASGMENKISFSLAAAENYGGLSVTVKFADTNVTHVVATLKDADESETIGESVRVEREDFAIVDGENSETLFAVTYSRPLTDSEKRLAADSYYLVFDFYAEGTDVPVASPDYIVRVGAGFTTAADETIAVNETYTITYEYNGGELTAQETLPGKYSRKSNTITLPELSKTDWRFMGWYKNAAFTGSAVTEIPTGSTGDMALYAKWLPVTENIQDLIDVSIDVNMSEISVTNNTDELEALELVFTADEGYTSYRWTVDGELQSVPDVNEAGNVLTLDASGWVTGVYEVSLLATDANGDYYSYLAQVQWTRKFIVSFVTGTDAVVDTQYITEGGTVTEPASLSKTDFVFAGWYASFDDGETLSEEAFDFDSVISQNMTLVAKWGITLKSGSDIRTILKSLGAAETATAFAASQTLSAETVTVQYLDRAETYLPVWYNEDDTTIYYARSTIDDTCILYLNADCAGMFNECTSLVSIDLSGFDSSNVTSMKNMFGSCSQLETIIFGDHWNTANVTNMNYMFTHCSKLCNLDVSGFTTSEVTEMGWMFNDCPELVTLDLSSFDTSKVTSMAFMFSGCEKLTTIYVSETFTTDALESPSTDVFIICYELVGGSGTKFSLDCTDATYARIDGGTDAPGYFTAKE